MKIQLRNTGFAPLDQPVRGQGGFQNLLRKIQAGYDPDSGVLAISVSDAKRVIRYTSRYGAGGFQSWLEPLAAVLAERLSATSTSSSPSRTIWNRRPPRAPSG